MAQPHAKRVYFKNKYPFAPVRCETHKPMSEQLGYVAWFAWADEQRKKKLKQTQCPVCGRWYFPEEL